MVRIVSINVRGLTDGIKHRAVFNYYRQRADIICIQETHCTPELEQVHESQWGGKELFSNGTNVARGVCILFDNKIDYRVCKSHSEKEGRFIICELENIDDPSKRFTLCNIYGPNTDRPHFFLDVMAATLEMSQELVITGDFNLVMDTKLDRKGSDYNPSQARETLQNIIEECELCDIWRIRNPTETMYSWMRTKPKLVASRLDFALVTQGLSSSVINATYIPGILSDHLAFFIVVDQIKQQRGRGYWKFNNRLLHNDTFVDEINQLLAQKLREGEHLQAADKWKFLMSAITRKAKEFSKSQATERSLIISQLSEKVNDLQYETAGQHKDDEKTIRILQDSMDELNALLQEKAKETIFRTKTNWYELGEKSNKFFLNMEKRRYNARLCNKILINNEEISDPDVIRKHQYEFYKELYTSDPKIHFNLENTTNIRVHEEMHTQDEIPFSYEEMKIALKQLKSNKTPGEDGIPPELLKMFFKYLGQPMYEMICQIYIDKALPDFLSTGIINLIPKSTKDSRFLKHLRPITLLSSCYKVIEKMIGNQIEKSLENIINQDQTGFMKNRRISTNIRKIFDLMTFTEQNNIDTIILSLDFMKCFDKIEKTAILGSLKFFGFSKYIVDWTDIIYTGFRAKIQNNGYFTDAFEVQKGVHQGSPASSFFKYFWYAQKF